MFWDCSYCGAKKIPGYLRECVDGCGHPRPRKVRFYHSDPPTEATPEQAAMFGRPDPNWYCEGCDSGNRAEDELCWKCGTPRSVNSEVHEVRTYKASEGLPHSAKEAEEMETSVPAEPQERWHPKEKDPYNPQPGSEPETSSPVFKPEIEDFSPLKHLSTMVSEQPKKLLTIGGGVLGVTLIILLVYAFFFQTHAETVQVIGMSWSQSVHIEEYQTLHENGWSIPSGGRETNSYQKVSGQKKIHDGWTTETYPTTCYRPVTVSDTCTGTRSVPDTCYRTNGDGSSDSYSCTKTEPYTYPCTKTESESYPCTGTRQVELYHYEDIYSTWYEYDIERWISIASYPTSGEGVDIYYDSVQPVDDLQRRVEDGGIYIITFSSEDIEPFTRQYDLSSYLLFDYGQEHEAIVNAYGIVLDVK